MSDPTRPDITRPADLAGASLRELLDAWHRHTARLVEARRGLGDPLPAARLARHGLDALALGQAIADQLMAMRWVTAVDSLAHGATADQVATAMGLDADEVAAKLQSWADGQLAYHLITAAQHDEALALLDRAGGAR
jgi:hypothetical protein